MLGFINALPGAVCQGLIWGIMAIGVYITFKVLNIADLTVDGTLATGGAVCGILLASGVNIWLAMLIATIAGGVCGLVTGILYCYFGIPAILAGILTQLMLYSINIVVQDGANLSYLGFAKIISSDNTSIGLSILIALGFTVVLIAILYWFFGTEYGSTLRATGQNQKMAKAQGINVKAAYIVGLVISNAIVALSGALLAQYAGCSDVNMGKGAIVIGLAAVIIGTAFLGLLKKFGKNFAVQLSSCALGGIIYYVVLQFVLALGLNTNLLKLLSASVVALFLGVPYWKKTYSNSVLKDKISTLFAKKESK